MQYKKKVLLIHNIMAPYRLSLFEELAKQNIELKVFFLTERVKNRKWKINKSTVFKYKILPNFKLNFFGKDLFTIIINYTFPFDFIREKTDIVIAAGWADVSNIMAFFLSKLLKKKFIIWSESTPNEPSWKRSFSLPLVKLIVRKADACIASGSRAKQYLMQLGADEHKIFISYDTVDVDYFRMQYDILHSKTESTKQQFGIKTKQVILYVGQFIERKGVLNLLQAYNQIATSLPETSLVLVGYGPQKDQYIAYCKQHNLHNVIIIDHIEMLNMPKIYSMANILVLPSHEEIWGLVINEAMACGLPVITTDQVGCSTDLVYENINGVVIPHNNYDALSTAIHNIMNNDKLLIKYAIASRNIIKGFTIKKVVSDFIKSIDFISRNP